MKLLVKQVHLALKILILRHNQQNLQVQLLKLLQLLIMPEKITLKLNQVLLLEHKIDKVHKLNQLVIKVLLQHLVKLEIKNQVVNKVILRTITTKLVLHLTKVVKMVLMVKMVEILAQIQIAMNIKTVKNIKIVNVKANNLAKTILQNLKLFV